MANLISKKAAWKLIGEAYHALPELRTDEQQSLTYSGLCRSISVLRINSNKLSSNDYLAMKETLKETCQGDGYWFAMTVEPWSCISNRKADLFRGDFCFNEYYMLGGK